MSKKMLLAVIIVFILVGVFVVILINIFNKKTNTNLNQIDTFQAGQNVTKESLDQSLNTTSILAGVEIKSIGGTIQAIEGNKFSMRTGPLEPLADPILNTRMVTIEAKAKIILSTQKDLTQFQNEMMEFQIKMNQGKNDPSKISPPMESPSPFEKKEIGLSELKNGQYVTVIADKNIKNEKEFTAIQVEVQEIPIANIAPDAVPNSQSQ